MRNIKVSLLILAFSLVLLHSYVFSQSHLTASKYKTVVINGSEGFQIIDGFGVNITPAQWANGRLKPTLDLLVNDLGATLIRFDCVGLANWLDPAKRNTEGVYQSDYLKTVYTNHTFSDAWKTFRYFNSLNIKPSFSISGRIPLLLGRKDDPRRLKDFEGYAEMVVTMLKWARDNEHLNFDLVSPFNETDLGFPEGPKIEAEDVLAAVNAIVKKLDVYGLSDVKLILMDDAYVQMSKLQPLLSDSGFIQRIAVFGAHTYGSGDEGEGQNWYSNESDYSQMLKAIHNSLYKNKPCWMTEYGDLDQSNEVEYEFAWRSTRRLMKLLKAGFSGAQAWDAFDNLHEHDTAWAQYGLLKTDTVHKTYIPKHRYFAAKQIYRFVPKGYMLTSVSALEPTKFNIYQKYQSELQNVRLLAFVSPDKKDFTLVGMNAVESDVELNIKLKALQIPDKRKVYFYRTSRNEFCEQQNGTVVQNNEVKIKLKERSIFTLTTITPWSR